MFLFTFLLFLNLNAHAFLGDSLNLPPQDSYHQIESENFIVIYPERFATEARHSLTLFEKAHKTLAPFWGYTPRSKMKAIITDNQDFANGVTSAVGRQGIVLYLTAPDPYSSIGEYGHWLDNLIIHEYTHYITLERAQGFFSGLRLFFGDLIQPNHLWPTWLAEGVAVYSETEFTKKGRGHGTLYQTLTRDRLFHDSVHSFDQIFGPRPEFPFGETFYYSGYALVEQMAYELGRQSLGVFTEESSYRVAYFLNGTLDNIAKPGQTREFRDLWTHFYERKRTEMKPDLEWLKVNNSPSFSKHSKNGDHAIGARLSPDGATLAYFNQSGSEAPELKLVNLSNGKTKNLDMLATGAGLSFSKDSKKIFYSKTDFHGPFNFYSDLYSIEIESGKINRLTRGARAKDPSNCGVSKLVYSSRSGRFSEIRLFDPANGETSRVYRAKEYHHVANPRCSADGSTVYFSMHATDPLEAIYSFAIADAGKNVEPVRMVGGASGTNSGFRAVFPTVADNGLIYYTQDQDGYFSLARYNPKNGKNETLARDSGGYWLPDIVNDRIAFTHVESSGSFASVAELASYHEITKAPGKSVPSSENVESVGTLSEYPSEEKSYHFYRSMLPRYWFPILSLSPVVTELGMSFTGWDDLDQFNYNLTAYFDSLPKSILGSLTTNHRLGSFRLSPSFNSTVNSVYVDSLNRVSYSLERNAGIVFSRPFPSTFSMIEPYTLAFGSRTTFDGPSGKSLSDPELRVGAGMIYDSRLRFTTSIASEQGHMVSLDGREYYTNHAKAWKLGAKFNQLIPLYPANSSMSASFFAAKTAKIQPEIPNANVKVGGRVNDGNLDLPLRGYPQGTFRAKQAVSSQFEYRLPLAQVFNGFDTWPFFSKNFGVYGFFDSAKIFLDYGTRANHFTAPVNGVGGGLLVNTVIGYHIPFHITLEFAKGLNTDYGGEESASLYLNL